jgi:hypothetical protein
MGRDRNGGRRDVKRRGRGRREGHHTEKEGERVCVEEWMD